MTTPSRRSIVKTVEWLNQHWEGRTWTYDSVYHAVTHGQLPGKKVAGQWVVIGIEEFLTASVVPARTTAARSVVQPWNRFGNARPA